MSRWCICFRRVRARGSRCARAKFASSKNQSIFFKFELFEFVQTCCDVGEPRSQSARTFPVRAPHQTPDVDAHVSLDLSQNSAFGLEMTARSCNLILIFPRKNSRSCCIFSASSTPQRTQTSASIVAEIKLNADVLVASLMRSLPKKSRAQRCARANFASRTVEFIADLLRF